MINDRCLNQQSFKFIITTEMKIFTILISILLIFTVLGKSQYKVVNSTLTASNITLTLQYIGKQEFYVKKTSPIVKSLLFVLQVHSFSDFYFKITDINQTRFEIPMTEPFPVDPFYNSTFAINLSGITFSYTNEPFDFKITRKSTNATLFSTYQQNLIFSEYYIEIGTQVDSTYIYGLGQRFESNFRKTTGKWTIFPRDRPQQIDYGTGRQTYGFYPLYLLRQKQGSFHFNYFRNSNAMDVIVNHTQTNQTFVTYKTIGGIIHSRFILGDQDPEALLKKWNIVLGSSAIPPFWSMGFHQCRWGYKHIQDFQTVLTKFKQNDIPLDTIWSDIDYMFYFEDFTIDEKRFPLDRMKKILQNYYYVPIIDAGIKVGDQLYPYTQGQKRNVFLKTPTGKQVTGVVWPGATSFVDFLHPNATNYWMDMLDYLYKKVQFSGIWLDMNEFSNFCNGPCPFIETDKGGFDYTHDLPYQPGIQGNVEAGTVSLNSTHYGNVTDADIRIFNGFFETYNTNLFLKSKNKRPFIISRSSTLGSNKFGFHWTGDNFADFMFLRSSIADNFNFQLFGIQMVGADICGFGGNTNEELCARWVQLGSLYPFSRDHNQNAGIPQQPYALGPIVLQTARTNLKLRYSLLKYYYSIFVQQKGTGSIFRPVFFEYSDDMNLYDDDVCNSQFLIGSGILAAPIIYPKTNNRHVYLPKSRWYDLHTGKMYQKGNITISNVTLTSKVPLFLSEGSVIFMQDTTLITSTRQLTNVFQLVSGLRLDSRNESSQIYSGNGSMISIKDYNDETKLSACISQGCRYFFNVRLIRSAESVQLEINCNYSGGSGLNEEFIIDSIKLYAQGNIYQQKLDESLSFKGTDKKTITIKNNSLIQKDLKIVQE